MGYSDVFSGGPVGPVIRTLITKWEDLHDRLRRYLAGYIVWHLRPLLGTSCGVRGSCWGGVLGRILSEMSPLVWHPCRTVGDRWCDCVTAATVMGIPAPTRSDMMNSLMLDYWWPVRLYYYTVSHSAVVVGGGGGRGGSRKLWVGGRVCVSKGKALDRGTKYRAGGGYGRGVSPLPM